MDHGGRGLEAGMAAGGPDRLAQAVARWRRGFDLDAIRSDDVDELCDHFTAVLQARLEGGESLAGAIQAAESQLGSPGHLVHEMQLAQRPPHYYRRWCRGLAAYAVAQAAAILVATAMLSLTVSRNTVPLPAQATMSYYVSSAVVVLGLALAALLAWRFGLFSGRHTMARTSSMVAATAPIVGLGVALLVGLVFLDFWHWWLTVDRQTGASPWDAVPWVLLVGSGGPVVALTLATIIRQRHPALQ